MRYQQVHDLGYELTFDCAVDMDTWANPKNGAALCALINEATEWCRERYGHEQGNPRWKKLGSYVIRLTDPNDAFEFKLRWC